MRPKATETTKVYFFYSDYCPHCNKVKPLVDAVASKLNLMYCSMDEELSGECYRLAEENGVYAVPTLIVYEGENKTVLVGEDEVENFLKSLS